MGAGEGAREAATSLAADAKEAARFASEAVQKQAVQFAGDVGHELKITAEDQKKRGVEAIQCFARAISTAATELEHQSPAVAQSVRAAARKVEGLSHTIGSRNVEELFGAVTELARAQPTLFIGGAVAVGFALSRFLKSSATQSGRYDAQRQAWSPHQAAPLQPSMMDHG
jgi:hypothetical protein